MDWFPTLYLHTFNIAMRAFAFILSIFIAGQAFVPCSDGNTCDETGEITAQHDHSEDEGDGCTQFCVCSCCGSIFTVSQTIEMMEFTESSIYTVLPFFEDNYRFHFNGDVWRPPTFG